MNELHIEATRGADGALHVTLRGRIDEHFAPEPIIAQAKGTRVILDLSGVRHVSSVGVRELERFLERIENVTLVEISPAIATQVVLLPTLAARVTVQSVQLPFVCEGCGAERTATVPFEATAATTHAPRCTCGRAMVLDGIPEQYLPSW